MKYIHQIKSVIFLAVMGLLTLTGCEGGDLYNVDAPDWISQKIDSINKSKQNTGEEVRLHLGLLAAVLKVLYCARKYEVERCV